MPGKDGFWTNNTFKKLDLIDRQTYRIYILTPTKFRIRAAVSHLDDLTLAARYQLWRNYYITLYFSFIYNGLMRLQNVRYISKMCTSK